MHPALAVVLGLVLALLLSRWRVPMGAAFLVGAATMAFAAGMGLDETGAAFGVVFAAGSTWVFAAQVTLVFVLSIVLKLSGSLDVLVAAAGALISNRRLRLASLPALVGLLPMPGGAVVSAPLVDRMRCDVTLETRDKNLINYWFRHVWEVCWPLYPPLLLAATFLPDGDMAKLCASQAPLMLLLLIAGWWFVLRRVPEGRDSLSDDRPPRGQFVRALLPFIVVIVAMPIMRVIMGLALPASSSGGVGLIAALSLGLIVALQLGGGGLLISALKEKRVWDLLVLALGVKLFGGMVGSTGAAQATAGLVRDGGLPPLLAIALLPMFIGFVSGATIAVVTVSFPVIVALIEGGASADSLLPYLVLGYAMGFIGYMLSPVHMCLVLSSKFFDEPMGGAYRRLVMPLLVFLAGSVGVFTALRALLS